MGSQPVIRPHQDLSAADLRAVNSLHRQWQDKVSQPHFILLCQSNSNPDHSFGASTWGKNWQDAVNDFFGDGADGDHVRKCVRVVSVHDCKFPFQANNGNRVDN